MKSQFVTFEIAKSLKELGCKIISIFGMETALYDEAGELVFYTNYGMMGSGFNKKYIPAILWQQAVDWLREKFNLNIELFCLPLSEKWGGEVYFLNDDILGEFIDLTSTYENAREQAILKAIELCIKKK